MLSVAFHPAAEKDLTRIPAGYQEGVVARLKELRELTHPLKHRQVKKLKSGKEERFRLRAGNYRVKFIFRKPNAILVTRIQHRQAGY